MSSVSSTAPPRSISCRRRDGRAVAEQHAVGPVARLAQQLLRHTELVLELVIAAAQLLLQIANRQVRPDAREHFLRLERLVDEIDGAELEPAHLLARLGQRRQKDDRDDRACARRLSACAGLEAVHLRHHDVEQDQIRNARCAMAMASLPLRAASRR